jgi:hypothetical protein
MSIGSGKLCGSWLKACRHLFTALPPPSSSVEIFWPEKHMGLNDETSLVSSKK